MSGTGPDASPALLRATGVSRRFGGMVAVDAVDLAVDRPVIHLVIGPNGAGKTTLLNCLSGVDRPTAGRVVVAGRDVTGARADVFARLGVLRTFQHARPFRGLTLAENVMVGAHGRTSAGPVRGTLRSPLARREERRLRLLADDLLAQVGLAGRGADRPAVLPLADERRLEIARCLAGEPRLLLMDEPAAGLGDAEAEDLATLLRRLRDEHRVAVVLIEHHLELALRLAERVTVLDFGRVIAAGTPAEVRGDPAVVSAYLGVAG